MRSSPAILSRLLVMAVMTLSARSGSGQWTLRAPLPDGPRANAVAFVLDGLGYIAGGTPSVGGSPLTTVWAYDPSPNAWLAKAPLPNGGLSQSVGFSVDGKGYIACGNGDQAEVWRYDPQLDSWTQMGDFPGGQRWGAVAFVIGSTAYITSGDSAGTFMTDLWAYDAGSDAWEQRTGYNPSFGTRKGVAFSVNGKGYVTTGTNAGAWLHCYDPVADSWSLKASFGGGGRHSAAAFVANGLAYVGCGRDNINNGAVSSWWSYDSVVDQWTFRSDDPSLIKSGTLGFAIGSKGYVCGGDAQSSGDAEELWEFDTTAPIGLSEANDGAQTFSAWFDGASQRVIIHATVSDEVRLMDATGALISVHRVPQGISMLQAGPLADGLYLVQPTARAFSATRLVVAP